MRKIVIELTEEEINKLGAMVDVKIEDDADVEYCVRTIIETLGCHECEEIVGSGTDE